MDRVCQRIGCSNSLEGMRSDAKWCGNSCRTTTRKERNREDYLSKKSTWHSKRGRWLRHNIDPNLAIDLIEKGCAACGYQFQNEQEAHADHDHKCCPGDWCRCGKCFRGMLCGGCNFALGQLNDDPDRIRSLLRYLENVRYGEVEPVRLRNGSVRQLRKRL